MSRQIKFRYWDGDLKKMIYWHEVKLLRFMQFEMFAGSHKSEIMQYTGLADKNGTEVYEGDILKTVNGDWGVIKYESPYFGLTVSDSYVSLYTKEWLSAGEVIGNIYENPELLT